MTIMDGLRTIFSKPSRSNDSARVSVIDTPSYKLGKETEKLLFAGSHRGSEHMKERAAALEAKADQLIADGNFNFSHFNTGFKLQDGTDYRQGGMDILFLKKKGVVPKLTRDEKAKLAL